jgi:SAM-dependent methyltransferase
VQTTRVQGPEYIWGGGAGEFERLIEQGRFLGDLTDHLLRLAGIELGMRVLDVGCGAGDVSFLAARLVGPEGAVIGVDISAEAIGVARERARQAGLRNMEFIARDAADLSLDAPVDAIIGRLALIFFDDPADLIRRLLPNLRSGGVVAFQEWADVVAVSDPRCALFDATIQRLVQTFTRAGYGGRSGYRMRRIFQDAGLPAPQMRAEARVEGGPDSPLYALLEQLTRGLLPAMAKTGVATAEDIGIDTLAARLREEAVAQDAVLALPPLVGAWARKSAA